MINKQSHRYVVAMRPKLAIEIKFLYYVLLKSFFKFPKCKFKNSSHYFEILSILKQSNLINKIQYKRRLIKSK